MWAAGGRREIGRPKASSKLVRGLAESKLNTIADRISVALNDDKITEEEFRLILSEVDRGHQKHSGGLSEDEKKTFSVCVKRSDDDSTREVIKRNPSWNQQWHMSISCWQA